MKTFKDKLIDEVLKNLNNKHSSNYNYYRLKRRGKNPLAVFFKKGYRFTINKFFHNYKSLSELGKIFSNVKKLSRYFEGFEHLYNVLADQESERLLTKLIAYKILGHEKVKLPLNKSWYWKKLKRIKSHFDKEKTIENYSSKWKLRLINLEEFNYPIELYQVTQGIMHHFILKHYEYKDVKVEKGDMIIDGGSCWGDTALFFSYKAGKNGKVFSFEFSSNNLKIFDRNLKLNPKLESRIHLVKKALWSKSGEKLFYKEVGPGTRVEQKLNSRLKHKTTTISIDDFIENNKINKVDFIKMDIEGAELKALKGAKKTIRKHKPKLAISIYHSLNDFVSIPKYLSDLGVGYKFYLGHFTIHDGETVLFAK